MTKKQESSNYYGPDLSGLIIQRDENGNMNYCLLDSMNTRVD